MKSFTIKNIMGLLSIILVLCCTLYFTFINFKYPLVGIEVMNQNGQRLVKNIYEKGWANEQPIEEEDIIKLVNGENPEDHSTVSFFNRIEKAESITIKDKDLQTKTYSITYDNLIFQYVLYLLLPLFFSMTTISLGAFLYRKKKEDRSAIILIYFLLSIGVCYFSATTSARERHYR